MSDQKILAELKRVAKIQRLQRGLSRATPDGLTRAALLPGWEAVVPFGDGEPYELCRDTGKYKYLRIGPACARALVEQCSGRPVRRYVDAHGLWTHPRDTELHEEAIVGLVRRAWAETSGLHLDIGVFSGEFHAELLALEGAGRLATAAAISWVIDWDGAPVVERQDAIIVHPALIRIRAIDVIGRTPSYPGAQILRRLGAGEGQR